MPENRKKPNSAGMANMVKAMRYPTANVFLEASHAAIRHSNASVRARLLSMTIASVG
jgi:hypothetical protein